MKFTHSKHKNKFSVFLCVFEQNLGVLNIVFKFYCIIYLLEMFVFEEFLWLRNLMK